MRLLAAVALVGIQQVVPGPLPLSLAVVALAAAAGGWAIATLRR